MECALLFNLLGFVGCYMCSKTAIPSSVSRRRTPDLSKNANSARRTAVPACADNKTFIPRAINLSEYAGSRPENDTLTFTPNSATILRRHRAFRVLPNTAGL